jgi:hypothetical protein
MLNEIYLTPRNIQNKKTGEWRKVGVVVFSYHFVNRMAVETKELKGIQSGTKIEKRRSVNSDGSLGEEKEVLLAWAKVTRKDCEPTESTALMSAYYDSKSSFWQKDPYAMLEKCAISKALRLAFPDWLSGVHSEEEMGEQEIRIVENLEQKEKQEKAEQEIEKLEELLEKKDYAKVSELVEEIRRESAEQTKGLDPQNKMEFMRDVLGVKKFEDLSLMSEKTLSEILVCLIERKNQDIANKFKNMRGK